MVAPSSLHRAKALSQVRLVGITKIPLVMGLGLGIVD